MDSDHAALRLEPRPVGQDLFMRAVLRAGDGRKVSAPPVFA